MDREERQRLINERIRIWEEKWEEYKRFEGEKTLEQWGILTNERMIIWEEKWRYHQTLEEDERLEERQRLREERIRISEEKSNEYVKHMTKIYEKRIIQVHKRIIQRKCNSELQSKRLLIN